MLRRLHSLAGLALALMLVAIAATGVGLSLQPAADRLASPAIAPGVSVAALAEGVAARHQRVDAIRVRGDGAVTVSFNDGATFGRGGQGRGSVRDAWESGCP